MKKVIGLLSILLLALPGCWKKKDETRKAVEQSKTVKTKKVADSSVFIPLKGNYEKKGEQSKFFDEEVEAFVLEEEAETNLFADQVDRDTIAVAQANEPEQEFSWVQEIEPDENYQIIHFDWDRYNIRADQLEKVKSNIGLAQKNAQEGKTIVVEGHADKIGGSDTYNHLISERRSRQIARSLQEVGIDKDHIKIVGRGNQMPVVLYGDKAEQEVNRRVEIYTLAA